MSSQILVIHCSTWTYLFFHNCPCYLVIQVLINQYPKVNPIKNNILLAYLGNYGPSYVGYVNIPNPWTMICNCFYPWNPPFFFLNTLGLMTYRVPNVVSTQIVVTRGNKGVQAFVMAFQVTIPIVDFLLEIWCPISCLKYYSFLIPNVDACVKHWSKGWIVFTSL